MQVVQAGQAFSFNYTDSYQRNSLFVSFEIWDVTSVPALITTVVGTYASLGSYMGNYTGVIGHQYMIIGLVFTDGTYTVVDTSSPQTADIYQVVPPSGVITNLGFCYASFDFATNLFIKASVFKMTTGSPTFQAGIVLDHVAHGVYYNSYAGTQGNTYDIISAVYTDGTFVTPNLFYAPASDSFDSIKLSVDILVTGTAHLIGQGQGQTGIITVNPPIHFTQGDDAVLQLIAVDVDGNGVNLTNAVFTSFIRRQDGTTLSLDDSHHFANVDQTNFPGYYTLTLAEAETSQCGLGEHKEILTLIDIGGAEVYFRGFNALQVYSPEPFE